MTHKPIQNPWLKLHKTTAQGYVRLDGVRHSLGRFDEPATRTKGACRRRDRDTPGETLPCRARRRPERPIKNVLVNLGIARLWQTNTARCP